MQKRTVRILTIISVTIVVAVVATYGVAVAVSARKLRRAYAALEKDGRPMHAADVIPPPVGGTENAAPFYAAAMAILEEQPWPEQQNLANYLPDLASAFVNLPDDAETQAHFRQVFAHTTVQQAITMIEQGAQRPACQFERDYSNGPPQPTPHISRLRGLVCLLDAKACLETRDGRVDLAWDTIRTQVKVADALRSEPVVISRLVRMGMIGLACQTIRRTCDVAPPTELQYEAIAQALGDFDDIRPLVRAIDGERLLVGERVFDLPRGQRYEEFRQSHLGIDMPSIISGTLFYVFTIKPLSLADHAAYLELTGGCAQMLEGRCTPKEQQVRESAYHGRLRYPMTNMLSPTSYRIKEMHSRMAGQVRVTRAGLALLRHKQIHGAFPETLDALDAGDVSDPFADGPLVYHTNGDNFVVYSVGDDRTDNGGSPKRPRQNKNYDIVWQWPAPQSE